MTRPHRMLTPRSGDPAAPPPLEQAEADVATVRAVVDALRRRVAAGLDGASSLATAEYKLAMALRRLDEARRL